MTTTLPMTSRRRLIEQGSPDDVDVRLIIVTFRLSSFSNVLGNVLATVYTTQRIYIVISWRYNTDHAGKRSRKVLFLQQEVVCMRCIKHDCKSLPQSSRQTVRQRSVSIITPKLRWYYRPWYIVLNMLFACINNRLSIHLFFAIDNFPTVLYNGTPPTANNF